MIIPQPIKCRARAFEVFAAQVDQMATTEGLLHAAAAIAMHEMPETDPHQVSGQIDALAEQIRRRVRSNSIQARLAHAHDVLFEEYAFKGNTLDYHDPGNSYLPMVLQRRVGLPITLTLLYKCVLERLGLTVYGINAPAHFLAGVRTGDSIMLVDPFFGGRVVTAEEIVQRVERMLDQPIVDPAKVLPAASHHVWIARLLQNLILSFQRRARPSDMAAMQEMLTLLTRRH